MGITLAHTNVFFASRHVYEHCCSLWCAPCQVSGQFDSGTVRRSLPAASGIRRSSKNSERPSSCLSRFQEDRGSLRKVMVCAGRISQAVKWPIGVPKRSGRRKFWRRSCRPQGWTLPACQWRASSMGFSRLTIPCWRGFNVCFVVPSSNFSRRKSRFLMRSLPNVVPSHCSILAS
jgi:hypothetical protein